MATDQQLLQIVDQALAETAAKSGPWLVCRPGCAQCCIGIFAINALDANRLRAGLDALRTQDPAKAARLAARVHASWGRLQRDFPGNPETGILGNDEASQEAFEGFGNEEVCPVLDPEHQTCDLYSARPMTCRVFGPPVRSQKGLGMCELCFVGATPAQIAACEMIFDIDAIENALLDHLHEGVSVEEGNTLVAYALRKSL